MNPGDVGKTVIYNHPQEGRVAAKVLKKIPNHDAYLVEYERGRGIVVTAAQTRHLSYQSDCVCGDPLDCNECAA